MKRYCKGIATHQSNTKKNFVPSEIKFHEQNEGWTHEYLPDGNCVCINRPGEIGGGFVTIDFKRRIFGVGYGAPRFAAIALVEYKGRDWQQRLVDAAVKHLNDVMN